MTPFAKPRAKLRRMQWDTGRRDAAKIKAQRVRFGENQ